MENFDGRSKLFKIKRLDILTLTIVALIGIVHLPHPFHGDQAFFTQGAYEMSQGEFLYRDFWDLKQPGIFWFYFLGGSIFGFNEIGIHAFELIYLLIFSMVLILSLNQYYKNRWILSLVPILTVGFYYSVSGSWHLTQVESLVGFPLFLSTYFAVRSVESPRSPVIALFLSGFMGGLVILFKFIFLPIIILVWFLTLVYFLFLKKEKKILLIVHRCVPIFMGLTLPILLAVAYFSMTDSLTILYETSFVYPPKIVAQFSANSSRFLDGLKWFLIRYSMLIVLSFIALFFSLKQRKQFCYTLSFLVWILTGLFVIFLQRQSLWEYHYLLLSVPVGILAAKGLDVLFDRTATIKPYMISIAKFRYNVSAICLILLAFIVPTSLLFRKIFIYCNYIFSPLYKEGVTYQIFANSNYRTADQEVSFLRSSASLKGNIYVFGDPIYYYLSNRAQAIAIHAWSAEFWIAELWEKLYQQLNEAKPAYIFVRNDYVHLISLKSPNISALLMNKYLALEKTSKEGRWYVLRDKVKK